MHAQEAMTKDVISVGPTTPVAEIAKLLVNHRIGAVPVVSADKRVIGIVSQTDLGHRSETGTEKKRKWWLDMFADSEMKAREYVKSHGQKAEDVMTRHVVTVRTTATLAEVADTLDTHHIHQVPVVDGGKLVGIISRSDLVRRLLEVQQPAAVASPDNSALQKAIWSEIKSQPWLQSALINFSVHDGVVEMWGAIGNDAQRRALEVLVEGVSGVRKVENNVGILPKAAAP